MKKKITFITQIPNWIIWVQCFCFFILYAIWGLPATILVRHICLIIGATLSLLIIYRYRHQFFKRQAIPIWLILALFAWMTFHLLFLAGDFSTQLKEYTSIWKRTFIGSVFALGFGVALSKSLSFKRQSLFWAFIFLGLLAPVLIYIFKYAFTFVVNSWGFPMSDYWLLYFASAPFFIPKITYVCFCIPTLSIALGQLALNINQDRPYQLENVFYLLSIFAVLFVFYSENIKNGAVYSTFLITLFMGVLIFRNFQHQIFIKLITLIIFVGVGLNFMGSSIKKNDSWRSLVADSKIALDTEKYPYWKYNAELGYPRNEFGDVVSVTNYERIAWGKVGLNLIVQNPFGYGLIERSFGHLAKIKWPDSKLHQSHSGWIDLTLGIGVPGIVLIFTAILNILYQLFRLKVSNDAHQNIYNTMAFWGILGLLMIWCTTEISQKVYFDQLIFWISLGSGVLLGQTEQHTSF